MSCWCRYFNLFHLDRLIRLKGETAYEDIWFQNCCIASIAHELEELVTQTGCKQIYCSIYKIFGHVLKNILIQFSSLGSPSIQTLPIETCWINICINHKSMRPKTLSNWLADFWWQLLCCWMVIFGSFCVNVRIASFTISSFKTFMWCRFFVSFSLWRAFCNTSASLSGNICVDGYLRFLLLKFCLWRALYFLSIKGVTFLPNTQELWNPFNSLGLTFAPVI